MCSCSYWLKSYQSQSSFFATEELHGIEFLREERDLTKLSIFLAECRETVFSKNFSNESGRAPIPFSSILDVLADQILFLQAACRTFIETGITVDPSNLLKTNLWKQDAAKLCYYPVSLTPAYSNLIKVLNYEPDKALDPNNQVFLLAFFKTFSPEFLT